MNQRTVGYPSTSWASCFMVWYSSLVEFNVEQVISELIFPAYHLTGANLPPNQSMAVNSMTKYNTTE